MPRILSSTKLQKAVKSILLLFFSVLLAAVCSYTVDTKLRVRTIRIEGFLKGQTLYGLKGVYNESMILLQEEAVAKNIKDNNPNISKVLVTKRYPDTLILAVSLYRPAAYLAADKGYFVLSGDGRILGRTKDTTLEDYPLINYYQKISYDSTQPGSYLSLKDILLALYFSGKVKELGMRVDAVDIDGVDMIGLKLDGKVIRFSSVKEKELQVYQMEQIVHQFRVEGKNFTQMDLRYNKPILELAP